MRKTLASSHLQSERQKCLQKCEFMMSHAMRMPACTQWLWSKSLDRRRVQSRSQTKPDQLLLDAPVWLQKLDSISKARAAVIYFMMQSTTMLSVLRINGEKKTPHLFNIIARMAECGDESHLGRSDFKAVCASGNQRKREKKKQKGRLCNQWNILPAVWNLNKMPSKACKYLPGCARSTYLMYSAACIRPAHWISHVITALSLALLAVYIPIAGCIM